MRVTDDITTSCITVLKMSRSHISCSRQSHSRIHLITKHGVRPPGCSCLRLLNLFTWPECSFSQLPGSSSLQIMVSVVFSRRSLLWPSHWNYNPQHPHKTHALPPFYTLFFSWHYNSLIWYICIYLYLFIHSFSITFQEFCLSYSLWCPSPTQNDPLHPVGIQHIQIVVYCRHIENLFIFPVCSSIHLSHAYCRTYVPSNQLKMDCLHRLQNKAAQAVHCSTPVVHIHRGSPLGSGWSSHPAVTQSPPGGVNSCPCKGEEREK